MARIRVHRPAVAVACGLILLPVVLLLAYRPTGRSGLAVAFELGLSIYAAVRLSMLVGQPSWFDGAFWLLVYAVFGIAQMAQSCARSDRLIVAWAGCAAFELVRRVTLDSRPGGVDPRATR